MRGLYQKERTDHGRQPAPGGLFHRSQIDNPFRAAILILVRAVSIGIAAAGQSKPAVRDEAEAIRIAVAAWEPIYGAAHIAGERPFHATLHSGIWTVTGSLPKHHKGGVALAEISAKDSSIIRLTHGK